MNYAYMVFPTDECPFSILECAILVQLFLGVPVKLISFRMCASRKTVLRCRKKLETVGGRLEVGWFQDTGKVVRLPRAKPAEPAESVPSYTAMSLPFLDADQMRLAEKCSRMMEEAGYKEKYVLDIWQLVRRYLPKDTDNWNNFLWSFAPNFGKIEGVHAARQKNNKGNYSTSYELFRLEIPIICKRC